MKLNLLEMEYPDEIKPGLLTNCAMLPMHFLGGLIKTLALPSDYVISFVVAIGCVVKQRQPEYTDVFTKTYCRKASVRYAEKIECISSLQKIGVKNDLDDIYQLDKYEKEINVARLAIYNNISAYLGAPFRFITKLYFVPAWVQRLCASYCQNNSEELLVKIQNKNDVLSEDDKPYEPPVYLYDGVTHIFAVLKSLMDHWFAERPRTFAAAFTIGLLYIVVPNAMDEMLWGRVLTYVNSGLGTDGIPFELFVAFKINYWTLALVDKLMNVVLSVGHCADFKKQINNLIHGFGVTLHKELELIVPLALLGYLGSLTPDAAEFCKTYLPIPVFLPILEWAGGEVQLANTQGYAPWNWATNMFAGLKLSLVLMSFLVGRVPEKDEIKSLLKDGKFCRTTIDLDENINVTYGAILQTLLEEPTTLRERRQLEHTVISQCENWKDRQKLYYAFNGRSTRLLELFKVIPYLWLGTIAHIVQNQAEPSTDVETAGNGLLYAAYALQAWELIKTGLTFTRKPTLRGTFYDSSVQIIYFYDSAKDLIKTLFVCLDKIPGTLLLTPYYLLTSYRNQEGVRAFNQSIKANIKNNTVPGLFELTKTCCCAPQRKTLVDQDESYEIKNMLEK